MLVNGLLLSACGALFTGLHLFLLKCFDIYPKHRLLVFILFLLTLIISRFSLYYAMKIIKNPTLVYVINSFAIYVILLLSIFILKLKNINYYKLNVGIFLMISGLYFVISSHKYIV